MSYSPPSSSAFSSPKDTHLTQAFSDLALNCLRFPRIQLLVLKNFLEAKICLFPELGESSPTAQCLSYLKHIVPMPMFPNTEELEFSASQASLIQAQLINMYSVKTTFGIVDIETQDTYICQIYNQIFDFHERESIDNPTSLFISKEFNSFFYSVVSEMNTPRGKPRGIMGRPKGRGQAALAPCLPFPVVLCIS